MSRKKNQGRATKRRAAADVRDPSETGAGLLMRLLDNAEQQLNPSDALDAFETAAALCRRDAATGPDASGDCSQGGADARLHLRAVFGVGTSLWQLNEVEQAIQHFQRALEIDPDDSLFARYWLAASLLDTAQLQELRALLDRYDEPTAFWRYAQALASFAVGGDHDEARRLLEEARRLDSHFLHYLLGDGLVRADQPIRFQRGRPATHSMARLLLPAWRSVSGAASWARRVLPTPSDRRQPRLPFPREQLLDLPQADETWQVGLRKLDAEHPGDDPAWVLLVADLGKKKMRRLAVIEGRPTPDAVWREMLAAFVKPTEGRPQRPRRLDVPRSEFRRAWRPLLNELDIQCRVGDSHALNQLLEGMADLVAAKRLPSLDDDFDPRSLPMEQATWQVDFLHHPSTVASEEGGLERPWSVVAMDKGSGFVLCTEIIDGQPEPEQMWEQVARVMLRVSARPRRIELADADSYDFLRPRLEQAGMECVLADQLPELHAFCLQMASGLDSPGRCALNDGPGVGLDEMESFYDAAADYFRQAPWKHVPGEMPIEVQLAGSPARYAIVLGRTGVTLGLAVHESWEDALDAISGRAGWDELAGLAVIFEEDMIMAAADMYLVERHGWPIAGPEAYPAAMRFVPGHQPAAPTADQLELLAACLRCLPDFLAGSDPVKVYPPSEHGLPRETRLCWSPLRVGRITPRMAAELGEGSAEEGERGSGQPARAAAVEHVNRKGQRYYLHQGRTKTGKPKYFFKKEPDGDLCEQLPEGYEVYEHPRGQVYCRRVQPKLITDREIEVVRKALVEFGKSLFSQVDVKGKDLIIYEHGHPCLRFALTDRERRLYAASRWCCRGSIDGWLPIHGRGKPLPSLAEACCRHIGEESFFELI